MNEELDGREIPVTLPISVKSLASLIGVEPFQVIAQLMDLGYFSNLKTEIGEESVLEHIGRRNAIRFRIQD